MLFRVFLIFLTFTAFGKTAVSAYFGGTIYNGNPANYRDILDILQAGDTLLLAPGTYRDGLPIYDMNGTAVAPIIIIGPDKGRGAMVPAHPGGCG
jgi:hypothetical protein